MSNILHFIAGMIRLYALILPLVSIWNYLVSLQELKEQKIVRIGLLVILYHIVISLLLILFSICLASLSG